MPTSSLPLRRHVRAASAAACLALAASACRGPVTAQLPFPAPTLAADSAHHRLLDQGLVHHAYRLMALPVVSADDTIGGRPVAGDTASGPWMVQVLEADRDRCWRPFPYRGARDPSRAPLSALAKRLLEHEAPPSVVGGINADFFLFAPNGVLQGPHVHGGTVIAGPGDRAAVAVDSAGRLHVARLGTRGIVAAGGDTLQIGGWNRWLPGGLAYYDAWHGHIDSLRASVVLEIGGSAGQWRVERVDSAPPASLGLPSAGAWLVLGRNASPALRERVLAFGRANMHGTLDTLGVSLVPFHPMNAVGGHGVLLRAGIIPPAVDSTGAPSFARGRHPRSAVGWDASGRRVLLVAVDGRQPGYSVGMTLRELARTMRALGATEALNLDGGGSTTLVVARSDSARSVSTKTLNRPSDNGGERAIANALMIARSCAR